MNRRAAKAKYLDASAIVKIYSNEGGSDEVQKFFRSAAGFCSTSLCVMEALGILKAKWQTRKQIEDNEYFQKTRRLVVDAWSNKIEVIDINLFSVGGQRAVEYIAKKHSLDLSDALQLETILRGRYSALSDDSSSVLITADKGLCVAARNEGIRVWDCIREVKPAWIT